MNEERMAETGGRFFKCLIICGERTGDKSPIQKIRIRAARVRQKFVDFGTFPAHNSRFKIWPNGIYEKR